MQNMWQEVTSYLHCRCLSKEISKAVSNSKNETIQQNSSNEWGSELVGNELNTDADINTHFIFTRTVDTRLSQSLPRLQSGKEFAEINADINLCFICTVMVS
jgi:hypothetical protein